MKNKTLISLINSANLNRYHDGKVIDNYLSEPYHRKRIEIAMALLLKGISQDFPEISKDHIKVLDLGCGSGAISNLVFQMGFSICAADYSTRQIKLISNSRTSISQLDANDRFPFEDEAFHAIFCGELIEHLFDTQEFLTECNRILKPNGVLILTTPNLAGMEDRLKFLVGVSPRQINPCHPYLKLHIRQFTSSSLRKILSLTGYTDINIKSNYIKLYINETSKIHIRFLAKIFPSLGGSLICFSRKKNKSGYGK